MVYRSTGYSEDFAREPTSEVTATVAGYARHRGMRCLHLRCSLDARWRREVMERMLCDIYRYKLVRAFCWGLEATVWL